LRISQKKARTVMVTDPPLEDVPLGKDVEAQALTKPGAAVRWDIRIGNRTYEVADGCCEYFAALMLAITAGGVALTFLLALVGVAGALPGQRGNFTGIEGPK
jgi:hypothetical protein